MSVHVRPVPCDETARPGEAALPYAKRIARAKLTAALSHLDKLGGQQVLAADTVVWLDGNTPPLGKPADRDACARMLQSIAGLQGHRVTTAWALGTAAGDIEVHEETTHVWFRTLTDEELDAYLTTDAWADKAGGYGVQAESASWVTRIEGSYTNVVGLPVAQVIARLQERSP